MRRNSHQAMNVSLYKRFFFRETGKDDILECSSAASFQGSAPACSRTVLEYADPFVSQSIDCVSERKLGYIIILGNFKLPSFGDRCNFCREIFFRILFH